MRAIAILPAFESTSAIKGDQTNEQRVGKKSLKSVDNRVSWIELVGLHIQHDAQDTPDTAHEKVTQD